MRFRLAVLLASAVSLFAQADRPKTFQDEYDAWFKLHPLPQANASPEQRRAFNQEVAEASAQWVRDWPDDPRAWMQRFKTLARVKTTPDQQLMEIGDTLLKVAKEHPYPGFRFVPFQTDVAEIWTERKIRPEQSLALTQEAVREDKQAERDNPSAARDFRDVFAQGLFHTLSLEVGLAKELNKLDMADSAVEEKKQYLEEHPELPVRLEHSYLMDAGYLADIEGHKPDALLYYSEAFRDSPDDSSAEAHARTLWKELGGTEEGFNNWTGAMARIDRTPPTKQERTPWTTMNKPLTAFHGTDSNGKVWTIEDLKGKTTLINVWATWCRPCRDELPAVQTLFDQLRNRKDVQLLTVSVDDDFRSAAEFAKRQRYTFPTIGMSLAGVDKMVGVEGVPRTWIVDSTGSVRFETIGYGRALWPKEIVRQLEAVK